MYLQEILGILQGQEVKIKYDCDGGFETCSQERMLKLRYAEKNFKDNGDKHICRKCQLRAKNPMKRQEIKDKVKKTCEEKYGGVPMNSQEQIQKRKEKFQDESYRQQRADKHRATSLKKYGVEHPMQLESTKLKQKQTMQEKYGVDHPYQSTEIMEKMKQSNLEKHGVENVAQLAEVQIKMAQTTLEKYGVEHYNELPEMREYLRQNCREWLSESWANGGPMKGIVRPEEWNQKASKTVTEKILSGKFNPEDKRFYITGYFKSKKCKKPRAFFRSSLELMMHYIFDQDENVIWYENEPFAIPYEKSPGIIRNYIPDFFVFRKIKKPLLAEIKPAFRMREKEVEYKIRAGETYCGQNGFEFLYIDEKYIKSNITISLQEIKCLEQVELSIKK